MKFSSVSVASSLFALTSAQLYTETVPVIFSGAPPSTVTQTVTVTEGGSGGYQTDPPFPTTRAGYPVISDYITTAQGTVTSVKYDDASKSTVWVYPIPTDKTKHCTVASYDGDVINVNIVDITIIIIDGHRTTSTSTASDSVTYTPTPPPTKSRTTPPYSTGTGSTYGEIHHVTVGAKGQNLYYPNQVNANLGDIIRFNFLAKNHTVTQSDFNTPCTYNGGFDTGFNQFNPDNQTNSIVKDFVVTTTKPTWFHCAQTNPKSHCQAGMVLGINPAGKFDAFLEKAKNSGNSTVIPTGSWIPGVPAPTGYYTTSSKVAEYTPVYKYPTIKGRSFQA